MTNTYRISDAARASGFSESALRFYEREGIVVPERTESGYRVYGEEDLEALRFVARGKSLGLRLEDIADLLGLMGGGECEPVQGRMRQLITSRTADARRQVAELTAFIERLQTAADRLGAHTPTGPCDERCGCRAEPDVIEIAAVPAPAPVRPAP